MTIDTQELFQLPVLPLKNNQWVIDPTSDVVGNNAHYAWGDVRTILDVCYSLK